MRHRLSLYVLCESMASDALVPIMYVKVSITITITIGVGKVYTDVLASVK